MICKNCGHELEENATTCSQCGLSVEEADKIQITYEDEQVEYVEPPVITEAHTFIDEESFAKKIHSEKLKNEEENWEEETRSNPFVWVLVTILFVVVGLVGYFVVYPNIVLKNQENNEIMSFTTEDWKSGEFVIDGDFYTLKKTFRNYYENHWDFVDEDTVHLSLDPDEVTEELAITNAFNKETVRIRIKNSRKAENTIMNSVVWSIQLDNTDEDHVLEFELPGGIKNGSKELEILSLYGTLTEDNIIRDDENHSTTYHYTQTGDKNLDLVVDDEKGLIAFHYYFF